MKDSIAIDDLASARAALQGISVWCLTDGKAGDEAQCLGVAERLALQAEVRRVAPKPPFEWLMPHGPIDPSEGPGKPGSPIRPPFPDLLIGSGRRAVAYLRRVKRESGGRTFTVCLKDPRTGAGAADMIWVPEHDPLRADNVLVTLSSPHRISPERLVEAAGQAPPWGRTSGRPVVAVLLGGDSQHYNFTEDDNRRLTLALAGLQRDGAFLAVTPSRRTPDSVQATVRDLVAAGGGYIWDGTSDNPLMAMLAHATAIIVTADSVNMVGEAAATGKPILLFTPSGGHGKIQSFLDGLELHGAVRPLSGRLELWSYEPLDATPVIAIDLARRFVQHRDALFSR